MQLIVVVSMCNKIRVVKISYSSLLILTNESVVTRWTQGFNITSSKWSAIFLLKVFVWKVKHV